VIVRRDLDGKTRLVAGMAHHVNEVLVHGIRIFRVDDEMRQHSTLLQQVNHHINRSTLVILSFLQLGIMPQTPVQKLTRSLEPMLVAVSPSYFGEQVLNVGSSRYLQPLNFGGDLATRIGRPFPPNLLVRRHFLEISCLGSPRAGLRVTASGPPGPAT